MTQTQFLRKLGITKEGLQDLLSKYAAFEKTLDAAQLKVVERTLPTIKQASQTFGPDLREEDLTFFVRDLNVDGLIHIYARGCFVAKLPLPQPDPIPKPIPTKRPGKKGNAKS